MINNLNNEIWKVIKDFPDYQVSNLGRVKSFKCGKEKILEPWKNKGNGYLFVCLYKNGESRTKYIHTLMFEAFKENIPEGCVVHHIDFTTNNILENFQIMTRKNHTGLHHKGKITSEKTRKLISENHIGMLGLNHSEKTKKKQSKTRKEKFKNGEINQDGENNPVSVLKEKNIIEIRIDLDEGILTQAEIGKKFGVSQAQISLIKLRKIWKHI